MPSETAGNSSLPIGDNYYCTPNLNDYRIAQFGGSWAGGDGAGGFYFGYLNTTGLRNFNFGGRLLFVPTAQV